MEFIINLLVKSVLQVWISFTHNWPYLVLSVIIAVCLKLFLDPKKISTFLMRYRQAGVIGATVVAVTTPLCSCGTTAVVLGMMASMVPWAPIIAFMVSSPLSSPEGMVYSAGLFGWPFAIAMFGSSILLGLLGGLVGDILERRGWLANQTRFSSPTPAASAADAAPARPIAQPATFTARSNKIGRPQPVRLNSMMLTAAGTTCESTVALTSCCEEVVTTSPSCACGTVPVQTVEAAPQSCACSGSTASAEPQRVTWRTFLTEAFTTGKRLLVMFLGFAFIGYVINGLVPAEWVAAIFGKGNIYSVPLAATLGLPFYINSEGSLPLVRAMIDSGMSQGAAMAFLITGAGTSVGAVAGALTIARWRVLAVVVGTLWVGAVLMGYLFNFLLVSGLI